MTCFPLVFLISASALGVELGQNLNFQDGLSYWNITNQSGFEVTVVQHQDDMVARLTNQTTMEIGYPSLSQNIEVLPNHYYEVIFEGRSDTIVHGVGGYAVFEYIDSDGQRMGTGESNRIPMDQQWHQISLAAVPPLDVSRITFGFYLHGNGQCEVHKAQLRAYPLPPLVPEKEKVSFQINPEPACENLIGFGAEDDGWFYAPVNQDKGITEADIELREKRIRWLKPDWQRMFFWLEDWLDLADLRDSTGEWQYDWDSPNMLSKYRTLDLYKEIGAEINITNVEWNWYRPYLEAERIAPALAELVEHLVKRKGYSNIRYWTLTNEPNHYFTDETYDFDTFRKVHQLVRAEFERRGLDVKIIGSDDAQSKPWFEKCVSDPQYSNLCDVFASHRYFFKSDVPLVPQFLDSRFDLLARHAPEKPFILAEYGFNEANTNHAFNEYMRTYEYAVWTARSMIELLNRGGSGASIWVMHEVAYPGDFIMRYGLWNWKDADWSINPVFHAMSLFTRYTNRGDAAYSCHSDTSAAVLASVVGNAFFWVNSTTAKTIITLPDRPWAEVRVYDEETISQPEQPCHVITAQQISEFNAPPMSFGVAFFESNQASSLSVY